MTRLDIDDVNIKKENSACGEPSLVQLLPGIATMRQVISTERQPIKSVEERAAIGAEEITKAMLPISESLSKSRAPVNSIIEGSKLYEFEADAKKGSGSMLEDLCKGEQKCNVSNDEKKCNLTEKNISRTVKTTADDREDNLEIFSKLSAADVSKAAVVSKTEWNALQNARELLETRTQAQNDTLAASDNSQALIRIDAIESHLPFAVAHAIITSINSNKLEDENELSSFASEPVAVDARNPVKILKLDLEPVSLGCVSVKMRMSQSRIEVQIVVETTVARSILHDAKDKLASAIATTGCKMDAIDIRINPTPQILDHGFSQDDRMGQSFSQGAQSGEQDRASGHNSGRRDSASDQSPVNKGTRNDRSVSGCGGDIYI